MRARLRRIGVRSVFLLFLLLYGVVGLLVGAGVGFLSTLELSPAGADTALDRLGWWSLALFPALYGIAGGLTAAVAAVLYNAAAAVTGGVKLEVGVAHEVEVAGDGHGREQVEVEVDDTRDEPRPEPETR